MSVQEKKTIVSLLTNIVVFVGYGLYVYFTHREQLQADPNDLGFWGKAFLIIIPVSIVAHIVAHIILTIINKVTTDEGMPNFVDELDKQIELRSIRSSHWTFIIGFCIAMTTQVLGQEPFIMMLTLFVAGWLASVIGDCTKVYLYRKGV